MIRIGGFLRMASAVFCIVIFMSFSALAADPQPPFFGPPDKHVNTKPGLVDVNGSQLQAYPKWQGPEIYLQNPWEACTPNGFLVLPSMTGALPGIYDKFTHNLGSFTVNQFDGQGYPVGGSFIGFDPSEQGTLTFEKSVPGQATYNLVRLTGVKASGPVNVLLSLVEQNGYIGVANIATLGVIEPCVTPSGTVDANSQIWLPLGRGTNGQRTVVPDINGDGVADTEFRTGLPLSGAVQQIPTLTEWGLIALTLILLILGLRFSRKNTHFASA